MVIKLKFFLKKTETGSNRPVSVRFNFLGKNRFKPVWLGFRSVFSVWLGFFPVFFGLDLVQFSQFQAYEIETEPVIFFKILISLIGFFYGSVFSVIFFWFSQFFNFLYIPNWIMISKRDKVTKQH
jgi:hypothetical protein